MRVTGEAWHAHVVERHLIFRKLRIILFDRSLIATVQLF